MAISSNPTHPEAAQDLADDVTAHSRRLPPKASSIDDVDTQGTGLDGGQQAQPQAGSEDVEGHVSRGRGFTDDSDDVEGHVSRGRGFTDDSDDVEGHAARAKF